VVVVNGNVDVREEVPEMFLAESTKVVSAGLLEKNTKASRP
jgi:hypothetical protein